MIVIGTVLLFLLDILVSVNFGIVAGLVISGFIIFSLCINWLNAILSSNKILSNVVSFGGFMILTLGFWFILVRTIASPPVFATNDIGIYWFTQSYNLLWSFLPLIFIFFGFFLYNVGRVNPVKDSWD
ncbi:MAG: hypothetical protein ACW967_06275 [Candidatus Hodarchaeales archaeon]